MTTNGKSRTTKPTATSASSWKQSNTIPLTVPSGNVALVKNPGMQAFLNSGMIPNSLLPLVTEALDRGKPPSAAVLREKANDLDVLKDILEAADAVTLHCVIEPAVRSEKWQLGDEVPDEVREIFEDPIGQTIADKYRDSDLLYIDEVDMMDKMFIFQWAVGGTRDLDRFRQEHEDGMAALQHGADVGSSS